MHKKLSLNKIRGAFYLSISSIKQHVKDDYRLMMEKNSSKRFSFSLCHVVKIFPSITFLYLKRTSDIIRNEEAAGGLWSLENVVKK